MSNSCDTEMDLLARSARDEVATDFTGDTLDHVLTVVRDDGVFRHLHCRKPGSFMHRFTITTWPGELCISGAMGTFVFRSLNDMFEFFRSATGHINPAYWGEKVVAEDRRKGGVTTFPSCWELHTYHFLWCCHAIVWAISQYDAAKAAA